jgi:hypothetical protein
MSRPRSRSERTLVRTSLCSRLEEQCLGRAYELALPLLQRRVAEAAVLQRGQRVGRCVAFPVPQQRVGG